MAKGLTYWLIGFGYGSGRFGLFDVVGQSQVFPAASRRGASAYVALCGSLAKGLTYWLIGFGYGSGRFGFLTWSAKAKSFPLLAAAERRLTLRSAAA